MTAEEERDAWQRTDLGGGAWIAYRAGLVDDPDAVMARLVETLPLASEELVLFGRRVRTPRLTSWHGDAGCAYRYSGRLFEPRPWTEELSGLRTRVREATDVDFNSVLVNYYRTGADAMGAHSDDERELGPSRDDVRIASVSLGAPRKFVLRSVCDPRPRGVDGDTRVERMLGGGDLLVMGGTTQRRFRHHVPRTKKPVGPRLNLTFRVVVASSAR